jgi:sterol desaturase/sphingolipid hydroxylase (fatty acid hydroxylase superfamily)
MTIWSAPMKHALYVLTSVGYWCVVGFLLERAFAARAHRGWHTSSFRLDAVFVLLQYALWIPLFNACLAPLAPHLYLWNVPHTTTWLVAGGIACIVLGDLCMFGLHVLMHRVPWLWRIHRVHHTSTEIDWLAAHREHPIDGLITMFMMNVPALLMGYPTRYLLPVFLARGAWAVFIHCNVRIDAAWFRVVGMMLGDPVLHRAHHECVSKDADTKNYGNLAPYLDVLFGTHHRPDDEHAQLGCDGTPARSYLQQMCLR